MKLLEEYELVFLPCDVRDESIWAILSLSVGNPFDCLRSKDSLVQTNE